MGLDDLFKMFGGNHGRRNRDDHHDYDYQESRQQPARVLILCSACGKENPAQTKFCAECGASLRPTNSTCKTCGGSIAANSKFCPECGAAKS